MSKESGLGANLYVAGVHLSNDIRTAAIACPRAVQDQTGIDKSAMERGYLTKDGSMALDVFWNPAAGRAHPVLSALPTVDIPLTYAHRPTLGAPAASVVAKQAGYDPTRAADGSISAIAVQALANGFGTEWGEMLTVGAVDQLTSGASAGPGLDYGAGVGTTLFGLQAYLHVIGFDGTDVTVAVQHSDDDGSVDPYADVPGGVFAQVTSAPGSQRLQTARAEPIKRWLRVNASGTFTSVDLVVMVARNRATVVF